MSNSLSVLICEDDDAIRGLLSKLLSRHGLAVESVATGAEAIERIRRRPYDLVLLDLLTPSVSGFEVLDLVARERPYLLRGVIVVTACQAAINASLPVAALLRKPFDIEVFDTIVERVLHTSEEDSCRQHRRPAPSW